MATHQNKSEYLQIRLSPAQKRRIERHAREANTTVSDWVLSNLLGTQGRPFQAILAKLALATRDQERLTLAELHDYLESLTPTDFHAALPVPDTTLSDQRMNIVAAMIETAARQKRLDPPVWTAQVAPLEMPYLASELKGLRLYLLVHSPVEFRRRHLFVDATIGDRV